MSGGFNTRRREMQEERLRILKMVEDGKIKADEAAKLLEALDRSNSKPTKETLKKRLLHIQVDKNGQRHVDVKFPLALLKLGMKFAPHHAKIKMAHAMGDNAEIDIEEILRMAQEGFEGKLVDVHDSDDDEHVVVRLE
jgi:hypothetical protein